MTSTMVSTAPATSAMSAFLRPEGHGPGRDLGAAVEEAQQGALDGDVRDGKHQLTGIVGGAFQRRMSRDVQDAGLVPCVVAAVWQLELDVEVRRRLRRLLGGGGRRSFPWRGAVRGRAVKLRRHSQGLDGP